MLGVLMELEIKIPEQNVTPEVQGTQALEKLAESVDELSEALTKPDEKPDEPQISETLKLMENRLLQKLETLEAEIADLKTQIETLELIEENESEGDHEAVAELNVPPPLIQEPTPEPKRPRSLLMTLFLGHARNE